MQMVIAHLNLFIYNWFSSAYKQMYLNLRMWEKNAKYHYWKINANFKFYIQRFD